MDIGMVKKDFIHRFMMTFLATYAATNYDSCCANDDFERIDGRLLVDALDIAESNWAKIQLRKS